LQETFIDVFRYIKDFRAESSLKTWITTIAIRKSIRALKKNKNFDSIDEHIDMETSDWNGEFTAEDLDIAIQSLPEKARAIFVAYSIEGFKHSEIAEMFDISEGTSKSTLHYSKTLLRIKLKELYE
jgi:RNA polymerase sigma factor (sigma-70 family)